MMDIEKYREFIASKGAGTESHGFAPAGDWSGLKEHQMRTLEFACAVGCTAAFLDTGLGKSRIEAAFAQECRDQIDKPSLILAPPAVGRQMERECEATGVEARLVRDQSEVWAGVNICNYHRLHLLDLSVFGCVVLDESSILKSYTGPTKRKLIEAFGATPFKMAATATPAPNDHMEIGQHAEFLGVMPAPEMLSRWFISDQTDMGKYRLKGHAVKSFWSWVASWARAASLPSDLGGDDTGYILPPLRYHEQIVKTDIMAGEFEGMFRMPDNSATSVHREKKLTIYERVARAAEIANGKTTPVIVFCETNEESARLTKAIPDAVEVHGSMQPDEKETALEAFTMGERRVIVSKPKLAGFGLNWQHAKDVVFASVSHSYEQHYQAVRRAWRYGQDQSVNVHMVMADTELAIWANVRRKMADHDRMKKAMTRAMLDAQSKSEIRVKYTGTPDIELPEFMRSEA